MRFVVVSIALARCSFRPGLTGEVALDDGDIIDAAQDSIPVDMVSRDARACYGAGLGAVCLITPPTLPRVLVGTFDTSGTSCDEVIAGLCVLTGTGITVAATTTFRAIGTRPLVVVASNTLVVDGTITVTSNANDTGAGASSATCAGPVSAPVDDVGGAGGGAGGSFGGRGGNGGLGDNNQNGGGGANLALFDAMFLADALAARPSIPEGLALYEKSRRPHLRHYQRMTRLLTPFFQSDSRFLGWLRDWTFPIANAIPPLQRRMVETMAGVSMGFVTRPLQLPLALKS